MNIIINGVIIINCHVNERGLWGWGQRGGGREEGRPYPSNLLIGLGKCIPSLCLLPRPSLTKYSVSTPGEPFHAHRVFAIHVHGGDDMNLYV